MLKSCIYMFDVVDTAFSYERKLIVRSFLQDFCKGKGSGLEIICNAHIAFLLGGAAAAFKLPVNQPGDGSSRL